MVFSFGFTIFCTVFCFQRANVYLPAFFYQKPARILPQILRTRNRFSATSVDQLPKQLCGLLMYGTQLHFAIPDVDRTMQVAAEIQAITE